MVFAMQARVFYPPLPPFWSVIRLASIVISWSAGSRGRRRLARHRDGAYRSPRTPRGSAAERRAEQPGILAVITGAGRRHPPGARRGATADPVVVHRRAAAGRRGLSTCCSSCCAASRLAAHPPELVLPALVKCAAGGTAYFGVISELIQQGKSPPARPRLGRSTDPDLDFPVSAFSWHQLTVCPPVPLRGSRGDRNGASRCVPFCT